MMVALTRSQQKRQGILAAARSLFVTAGIDATSMDRIAEEAQVSKRTVYNHFASKEQLVAVLLTEIWQRTLEASAQRFEADKPLAPQLQALLMAEVELFQQSDYLDLVRVALAHFMFNSDLLEQAMAEQIKDEDALTRWLAQAQQHGAIDHPSLGLAVAQLHGQIKGLYFWPGVMQLPCGVADLPAQQVVAETVAMFLARYQR